MASCDLLDLKCIFVNELIGSAMLSVLLAAIIFFIFSSKLKIGFRTAFVVSIPMILLFGMMLGGFSAIYAFITVLLGFLLASIFQKLIGNQGFI